MRTRLFTAPIAAAAIAALALPAPVMATPESELTMSIGSFEGIDFGDDAGEFARDGECDDLRFDGEGMTQTPLLAEDLYHDASDCRAAFNANKITLSPMFMRLSGTAEIIWGDDSGDFSRDGECDDMRFEGPGMTFTPLIAEDIGRDASDCRAAFQKGKITWRVGPVGRLDQEPASFS